VTRGGRRPGAGAPRGNLNRLTTGHRSDQLRGLFEAMLRRPYLARLVEALALGVRYSHSTGRPPPAFPRRRPRRRGVEKPVISC
jgi:hypothetical protein